MLDYIHCTILLDPMPTLSTSVHNGKYSVSTQCRQSQHRAPTTAYPFPIIAVPHNHPLSPRTPQRQRELPTVNHILHTTQTSSLKSEETTHPNQHTATKQHINHNGISHHQSSQGASRQTTNNTPDPPHIVNAQLVRLLLRATAPWLN
jgi:hypothetical protein